MKISNKGAVRAIIRIGMDTSKSVFQLHGVNAAEQPMLRKKMRRKEGFPAAVVSYTARYGQGRAGRHYPSQATRAAGSAPPRWCSQLCDTEQMRPS
ncbi:MAG: hypothetical protein EOR76_35405 [Mesorhizobium sp.]|nr:MAG: hypothetical protein EOR49_34510 [Mesorhizobium sp.]RWM40740.1 MAG: hypothetical protein EOR76_35405 [Mesorhizobium sp.]